MPESSIPGRGQASTLAAGPGLFDPVTIRRMTLPHRIITGPMEKGMAQRDGTLSRRYLGYLAARARGGAGLIQLESTYVDTIGMGHLYQVGCHDDAVVDGLRQAADLVHAHGASLALELYLGGRETPSFMSQRQPIAPSAVPCTVLAPMPTPREMTADDIDWAIAAFCAAGRRLKEAGVDMAHIHGAHGYLVGSFLSPFSNHRTDAFGGSLANRARFALLLVQALRSELGDDFPIGYRISASEFIEGGLQIEESAEFAGMLAQAGVDLIDVSGGFYESNFMIMQGSPDGEGGFLPMAHAIKAVVGADALVSVAQRLSRPGVAEEVIASGIDMVSMSRAFHADPEYATKRRSGRPDEVIPCIACHHCVDELEANRVADCSVNPMTTREYLLITSGPGTSAPPVASALVIGAGPGGLQAASMLAEQGTEVVLVDERPHIGGQMALAAAVQTDFQRYLDYAGARIARAGVQLRLGSLAGSELVRSLDPMLVVLATGALSAPLAHLAPEASSAIPVIGLLESYAGIPASGAIVFAGGDAAACIRAVDLARQGRQVIIVEPSGALALEHPGWGREQTERLAHRTPGIEIRLESTVESAGPDGVELQSHGVREWRRGVGVVVVGGRQPRNELAEALLADPVLGSRVVVIGDAVRPRDIHAATLEGMRVAVAGVAARLVLA